ncbi:MAG: sugar ABC transporter substrate-binding protein [Actinobacteria bacterium]|nr:MAG: sugar ABC transporter substrate-binding protein [Actinomycetota bacterium]TML79795.1 MAG: sugar ABC transporter substrate-binding protein [Actinomycetota bacterium]
MKRFSRRWASVGVVVVLAGVVVAIAATGATARSSANIQVCVLLPDTKSSVRWVQFDAPYFAKALKKAKVTYSITNALNDPQKMVSQADSCLSRGAKVAIVTDIAQGTSIAIEKKFAAAGGQSIDYDRQVVGGIAKVYVSFDGKAVGAAQARGVVNALKSKSKPVVAELWGGPTDQNAFWFKSGNDAVLNPLFKSGKLTKGPQQFVPLWLATNAQPIFEQMLLKTNNKIDGAIAANDGIAGAVIAALKAKKLNPIALSGQDATVQGVQNIISGWQTMTVYKFVPLEANAAAKAAVALLKHTKVPGVNGFRKNGSKKEPTVQIPVVSITKANYTRLFKDKFLKKSDVCIGEFAQFCK